jgi:hypothetical protein
VRAEIDENGCLAVISESPVEAFALKEWHEELLGFESKYTFRIVTDESEFD